jgi:hypothetical protein
MATSTIEEAAADHLVNLRLSELEDGSSSSRSTVTTALDEKISNDKDMLEQEREIAVLD